MARRDFLRLAGLLGAGGAIAGGGAWGLLSETETPGGAAIAAEPQPRDGGMLRCAMSVFDIADPALFDWVEMSNQARHQHEHLTITGADNITRPMLAERWAAADDLKTWTFFLREGVLWHNGEALTAEHVAFNFARWLDPATGSSNLGLFSALLGDGPDGRPAPIAGAVEVVDPLTLRLHLSTPVLSVPENLYNYPTAILHPSFSGDIAKDRNGTGPYQIVENRPGEISIARRAAADGWRYWGAGAAHVGPGRLDEIRYLHVEPGDPAAVAAVLSGEADLCHEVGVDSLAEAEAAAADPSRGVALKSTHSAQTGCMRMRVDQAPFDDWRVRRAVQLCCDVEAYPETVFGGRGRGAEHHHVAQIHPDYHPLPRLERDVAEARRLLVEAGHGDGLALTLDVGNTSGVWQQRAAELFARQAADAGIAITVNVMTPSAYREVWRTTPFGLTQWVHRPLGTMALALGYRSIAPWNETGYQNPAFDAALTEAEALIDIEARREAMAPVQRMLQNDAVMVQPFWAPIVTLGSSRLRGFTAQPTQYHPFNDVWFAEA